MSDTCVTPTIRFLGTVDSALTELSRLVDADPSLSAFTTVVARHQTSGRGRSGRTWLDEDGHSLLAATLIRIRDEHLSWATLLTGIALADTLADLGHQARLKWPNDVIINGRKAAGILAEHLSIDEESHQHRVAIGLGVNLDRVPADVSDTASSLLDTDATDEDRDRLRTSILTAFFAHLGRLLDAEPASWRDHYLDRYLGLGLPTTVHLPDGTRKEITPLGISPTGALEAAGHDGTHLSISVGDVDLPHLIPDQEGGLS